MVYVNFHILENPCFGKNQVTLYTWENQRFRPDRTSVFFFFFLYQNPPFEG